MFLFAFRRSAVHSPHSKRAIIFPTHDRRFGVSQDLIANALVARMQGEKGHAFFTAIRALKGSASVL